MSENLPRLQSNQTVSMLDLLLQCLGIIRSFYFLLNTVVHKSHCVQDLISLWHDRKCRTPYYFLLSVGLCVGAVQQALLWTKRGERRYWLSLLKDDILKWAVKIKRIMFLSISKRLFTTWQTYQYFNNQRKLLSNCISFRCFECFTTTRSLPFCKGPRERTKPQQPIKKKQQANERMYYTCIPILELQRPPATDLKRLMLIWRP